MFPRAAVVLTLALTLAVVADGYSQEKPKPALLDWSRLPVVGDKDVQSKYQALREDYLGKAVVAQGRFLRIVSRSARTVTIEIGMPMRRGELLLYARVHATFHDMREERFRAIPMGTMITVSGVGNFSGTLADMTLDQATFVAESPKAQATVKKPKPSVPALDPEAAAQAKLALCKQLIDLAKERPEKRDVAKLRLQELIRDHPMSPAAAEAKKLLEKL